MIFAALPNILSILRLILTVPIVFALYKHAFFSAIVMFVIAGFTDLFDGWLAKRFALQSRLGSILDPIADKVLLVSSCTTLYLIDLLPLWLLVMIFVRDLAIVAATLGYLLGSEEHSDALLSPSNISKINTALQIYLVIFLMFSQITPLPSQWMTFSFIVVGTSTALSGVDYVWLWIKAFILQTRQK